MLGSPCDVLASHPWGSRNTLCHFMLRKLELSADLKGSLSASCYSNVPVVSSSVEIQTRITVFRFNPTIQLKLKFSQ